MFTIKVTSKGMSERELADHIFESVTERVREKVRRVVCPEHGKSAHVNLVPDPAGTRTEIVDPCCQKLVEMVRIALKTKTAA